MLREQGNPDSSSVHQETRIDKSKIKKLLVVEDEIITALAESALLKNNGYEVQAVSNGEQAVEAVKRNDQIDLVLIDLNLGAGINGAETSKKILEIRELPIVFLTSYTGKEIVDQVRHITRYGYVIKGSGEYLLLSSIEMAIELFQSRKKLEAVETNFHQLTGSMNEVFWLHDAKDKSIVYLSPAYEKIWGRSCQSFYDNPKSFMEVIHPDDRERVEKIHKDMKLNPLPFEYEYRIIRDDGELRWIRARRNPVFDKNGKIFRYVGIAEDITQRKNAVNELQKKNSELQTLNEEIHATLEKLEAANEELVKKNHSLFESEEKFRNLTESSPIAIMIHQGNFWVYTNHIGVEISGYSEEELYNMNFWDFVDPEYQYLVRGRGLDRQNSENFDTSYEFSITTKDGSKKWVSLKGNSIVFNGEPAGMISVIDITARKLAENELIETNRELEAALEKSREFAIAAEAANIAKSQFLANMSHEIRTPMNGIIGITSLLLDSPLTDEQKKFIEIIQRSGDNLLSIINEILDLSKIESQKFELDFKNFNLQEAMYDIIDILALKASKKNLAFNFTIDDAIPSLLNGDLGRIRQVVINLTYNAIKFTDEGKVDVSVRMIDESDSDVKLKFEINDTGIGIQKEHLNDLFIPFTQVDAGMNRKYGGTGLGLAISKKIVTLMGGEIGVENNEQNGSLFWFTIVLQKQNNPHKIAGETAYNISNYPDNETAPILLVEDNKTNQFVAYSMLKKLGYKTDLASNGFECIEALKKKEYSAVFMDCQMPDMDGLETTIEIRSGKAGVINPEILIIALTAHAMDGDREKCIKAGMNDYIAKPVRMKEVDELLKRWLNPGQSNTRPDREI